MSTKNWVELPTPDGLVFVDPDRVTEISYGIGQFADCAVVITENGTHHTLTIPPVKAKELLLAGAVWAAAADSSNETQRSAALERIAAALERIEASVRGGTLKPASASKDSEYFVSIL